VPTPIDFASAFQNNMAALGLPAPSSLFGSARTANATLALMLDASRSLDARASIADVIRATKGLQTLGVAERIAAVSFIGAVIGSLVVATDAQTPCTDASAVTWHLHRWAARQGIAIPAPIYTLLRRHPEVIVERPGRITYALRAARMATIAA
jgi:hypothetical protein